MRPLKRANLSQLNLQTPRQALTLPPQIRNRGAEGGQAQAREARRGGRGRGRGRVGAESVGVGGGVCAARTASDDGADPRAVRLRLPDSRAKLGCNLTSPLPS